MKALIYERECDVLARIWGRGKKEEKIKIQLKQCLKYYRFLTEVLIPIVKTEFQLLYVYHLVGPFLQRFQQERTRCMIEVKCNSWSNLYSKYYVNFAIILQSRI